MPGFEVTDSLRHFAQLVAALYDRSHLPGFNEILQHQQVRRAGLRQQVSQPLLAVRKQWAEEQRFVQWRFDPPLSVTDRWASALVWPHRAPEFIGETSTWPKLSQAWTDSSNRSLDGQGGPRPSGKPTEAPRAKMSTIVWPCWSIISTLAPLSEALVQTCLEVIAHIQLPVATVGLRGQSPAGESGDE